MSKIIIGKSTLSGRVKVSGAKNSVLRLLAASLLTRGTIELTNYPEQLLDAAIHVEMLEMLGKHCEVSPGRVIITESKGISSELKWDGRSIRNTLLILGALVARTGYGAVPLPGGCKLGERAYDIHEMLLQRLGAKVSEKDGYLIAEAPSGGLIGTDIFLPIRSTGATENAILAGSLAKGVTRIWNPHVRPEIVDLAGFINKLGGNVIIHGQEHIEVHGREELSGGAHAVMPDNMEALTWLIAAVVSGGDVEIENFPVKDVEVALIHLRDSGAKYYIGESGLIVRGGRCLPLEVSTGPHPGINSDVQPILAAYAACAKGESKITDLRFLGRYGYADEMRKMGVNSSTDGYALRIDGGARLIGAEVTALDLRAGAALAVCALAAEGETIISDAWQIERGYNGFMEKLISLGANAKAF